MKKKYKLINPADESMDELRAWVYDQPRFRADVTYIILRGVIEPIVEEWDHKGSKALWKLYFLLWGGE